MVAIFILFIYFLLQRALPPPSWKPQKGVEEMAGSLAACWRVEEN